MTWLLRKIDLWLFTRQLNHNLSLRKRARASGLTYVGGHVRGARR